MAIRSTFTTGEVLTAADLTDTIKGAFINTETTTARTLGTADAGNLVTLNNNSGGTVTIPTNTTWGSPLGTLVHLINIGTAGSFTVGTAAGVTLNAVSATLAIQEGGTLIKTATNTWQFVKGGGLGKAQYSSTTGSPTVTTVSGKTCVKFTGSGSITISQAGTVEVLVVGGGGGSAAGAGSEARGGGAGGAGGLLYTTSAFLSSGSHTVEVGAGGAAGAGNVNAGNGITSRVGLYYAPGGGGGGTTFSFATADNGRNGGSGGGGGSGNSGSTTGGSGTSGQGNAGGGATIGAGGGGGGSGSAGGTPTAGSGTANLITGSSVTYAAGGTGGAGSGSANGTAGSANTGNGAGGGSYVSGLGAAGGSGIVILLFG